MNLRDVFEDAKRRVKYIDKAPAEVVSDQARTALANIASAIKTLSMMDDAVKAGHYPFAVEAANRAITGLERAVNALGLATAARGLS